MAVKMRINRDGNTIRCQCCNQTRQNSLEMFDLMIGNTYVRICDLCNDELFGKTLRATCRVNGKVKSQQDMKVIQNRHTRNRWR